MRATAGDPIVVAEETDMRIVLACLAFVLAVLLSAPTVLADTQQTVLARARVADMPADDQLLRVVDTTLPPGEPGVTHMHASGFDVAIEGSHVLTVGPRHLVVPAGGASWVGMQEEHTHASLNQAGMRFWFFSVRPASTRGAPPAWPYPTTRIRGESEDFRPTGPVQDLILAEVRLSRAGDEVGPFAQYGIAGVTTREGTVSLGGQALASEAVVVQRPEDTARFRNTGPGPARLLVLLVTPPGAPGLLPRTGGAVAPHVPLLPALQIVGLGAPLAALVSLLVRRRTAPRRA
jgi:hypothetical protein